MVVPKASDDLHAYNAWRKSLHAYPVGTIVQWIAPETLRGSTSASDIKQNQCFMILGLKEPITRKNDSLVASMCYDMQLCSPAGRVFKRNERYTVEGIARFIAENRMRIIA